MLSMSEKKIGSPVLEKKHLENESSSNTLVSSRSDGISSSVSFPSFSTTSSNPSKEQCHSPPSAHLLKPAEALSPEKYESSLSSIQYQQEIQLLRDQLKFSQDQLKEKDQELEHYQQLVSTLHLLLQRRSFPLDDLTFCESKASPKLAKMTSKTSNSGFSSKGYHKMELLKQFHLLHSDSELLGRHTSVKEMFEENRELKLDSATSFSNPDFTSNEKSKRVSFGNDIDIRYIEANETE